MIRHPIFAAITLCLGATLGVSAQAQTWTALDLGFLNSQPVIGLALNDLGQVAGDYATQMPVYNTHGFFTGPNGGAVQALGNEGGTYSGARGINDAGQVVGDSYLDRGYYHAYITGPNGVGMTDLGTLPGGLGTSTANDVNNAGQVTGNASAMDGTHIFITGPNGVGMVDLGSGAGNAINASGQLTGMIWSSGNNHAFVTDANGSNLRDLGTLGGANSIGLAINNIGQVVGYSDLAQGSRHAFLTGPNGVGMLDLGSLGGLDSEARGINDAGQVVGSFALANGTSHAFITGANGVGMFDLNSLVSLSGGAYFRMAEDVNNLGQVLARSSNGHSYLLTASAVPEPSTWALMALGLGLTGVGIRRAKRTVT